MAPFLGSWATLLLLVSLAPASATTTPALNDRAHLKYFGYWQSARPADAETYLKDMAGRANLTWAGVGDVEKDARGVFTSARQAGMRVFLDVEDFLVDDYQGAAGVEDRWRAFRGKLEPFSGDIAFFMLADEPEGGEYPWANKGDWLTKVKPIFESWRRKLNAAFPDVPTFINYTSDRARDWVPPYLFEADVLAFDDYFCWEKCYGGVSFTEAVGDFERKFPKAKILLLPAAHARASHDQAADEKAALEVADKIYAFAKTDPRVIGLMPWNWWSAPGMMTGAKHLPSLRERFGEIGAEIVKRDGLGTVCVDANARNGYFVKRQGGETWGWNGSDCWEGHAAGSYAVDAPGGKVRPEALWLEPGESIRFTVTFEHKEQEDPAAAFLTEVYPGADREARLRMLAGKLDTPRAFEDYLASLARTGREPVKALANDLLKDPVVLEQLRLAVKAWFDKPMEPAGSRPPTAGGGAGGVDPHLRSILNAGDGKDASSVIASMFASMELEDRRKLVSACSKTADCDVVQACIDTKLYAKCLAACSANPKCAWPGSEPGKTNETDENCSAPDNSQGAARADAGKGEICVDTDEGKAYFVVGPDQTWGWNGPKCFPGRRAGVYSVNTNGGYGYPKVGNTDVRAKIFPRSAVLTDGGRLDFKVHFCGHGYASPN
ncbi:MAG: hypothetical protein HY925_14670 [Elusimicrobia bacterium]|nr:hypothetical protein [Elusimicrobiota bacterium]